jgi:Interferon-induced transmembrane protein
MQPGGYPPGQDPYGQQQPYGQQPQYGQPYGQPQDPAYGQPTSGQPYGQPTSGQPYGQPTSGAAYGQPTTGQPYGQAGYGQPAPQGEFKDNMGMSIGMIFLFWPTAIPAIMNASKAKAAYQAGDYAGAEAAAQESRKWSKISLIIGLIWYGLNVLACCGIFGLSALGASSSSY